MSFVIVPVDGMSFVIVPVDGMSFVIVPVGWLENPREGVPLLWANNIINQII